MSGSALRVRPVCEVPETPRSWASGPNDQRMALGLERLLVETIASRANKMHKNSAIGIVICSSLIVGVSFLPWGLFRAPLENYNSSYFLVSFAGMMLTYTGDRLFSYLNVLGIAIPNCVLLFSALVIALTSAFRAMSILKFPSGFNILLALYGIVHSCLIVIILVANGSAGFGATLTMCMFVLMFVILLKGYVPVYTQAKTVLQPSKY